MLHWIAHTVGAFSYFGVGLLMAIENIILPLPSELIMPLAGARTNSGPMTLWGVILAGTIGSVVGGYPLFAAAWILGPDRVTKWFDRHGKWFLIRRGDLQRAHDKFDKRGFTAVMISQLIPGLRGLISIPAGFAHMNILLFTLADFAGTIVWCSLLAILGHELGRRFARVNKTFGPIEWLIVGALVLGAVGWLVIRRKRKGKQRR